MFSVMCQSVHKAGGVPVPKCPGTYRKEAPGSSGKDQVGRRLPRRTDQEEGPSPTGQG